jgi:DNA replication and repair protein RecF
VNDVDMNTYGSRGQQRTVALSLKLAEVSLMHDETGEMPILLLDDVLSELDQERCSFLLATVSQAEQVFITTTDYDLFSAGFLESAELWKVSEGTVVPVEKLP